MLQQRQQIQHYGPYYANQLLKLAHAAAHSSNHSVI
jgi:hypothetical protein